MIDKSYISFVNLNHRKDRLNWMHTELARIDLKAIRTRGLLPGEYNGPKEKIATMLSRPQIGAIGCMMSQIFIMYTAKSLGLHAWVMEDDLIFASDIHERLKIIEDFTDTHPWDVVWLGGTFHVPAFWHKVGGSGMPPNCSRELGKDCETTDNPRMIRTLGAFSTYAYIVNYESIGKILKMLDDFMPKTIGIDYSFIALQPDLLTYAFVPGCVKQMDNMSDIGSGMTVFSGFSKLNGTIENSRYWWQDKMETFDPTKFNWDA